jgi:Icc-related predicted phosphoesterase
MKVLALSDKIVSYIYSPLIRTRYKDVDLILGCGDLSYFYLEYVVSLLDKPLFYVRGNHDKAAEYEGKLMRTGPQGGVNLHRKVINCNGVILAGVEGSLKYRYGRYQYTQSEMWNHVFSLIPKFLVNRIRCGRYLDVFVTHAPPESIHDREDLPHQGIKAFRWLLKVFRPAYHFHGHIHLYHPEDPKQSNFGKTQVINAYGFTRKSLFLKP